MCVEDDIFYLVENGRTDMLVSENIEVQAMMKFQKYNRVRLLLRLEKGIKNPLQMRNETNQGIMISLLTCPLH